MHRRSTFTTLAQVLTLTGWGLFSFAVSAAPLEAPTQKIRAMGFGEGEGRVARTAALSDAERAAVELLVADLAGPRWDDTLEAIYAQPYTYVRTSRPLSTHEVEGGLEVEAEVYVYVQQLRRDVAALAFRELITKPRVAFLVAEEIEEARPWAIRADGFALRSLRRIFEGAGFAVVDAAAVYSRYSGEDLMRYQAGGAGRVRLFGQDVQADLVVRGDSLARYEAPAAGSNVAAIAGSIELEVVRAVDGRVVAAFESAARVHGIDAEKGGMQALEDAVARIEQDLLASSVLGYIAAPEANYFLVSVALPGQGPWLTRARRGIRARFPRAEIHDLQHTSTMARFRLDFGGKLSELVRGLTDSPHEQFRLETDRAVGRELDLRLVPTE